MPIEPGSLSTPAISLTPAKMYIFYTHPNERAYGYFYLRNIAQTLFHIFVTPPKIPNFTYEGDLKFFIGPNQPQKLISSYLPQSNETLTGFFVVKARGQELHLPLQISPHYSHTLLPPVISFGCVYKGRQKTLTYTFHPMNNVEYPFIIDPINLDPCIALSLTIGKIGPKDPAVLEITFAPTNKMSGNTLGQLVLSGIGIAKRITTLDGSCEDYEDEELNKQKISASKLENPGLDSLNMLVSKRANRKGFNLVSKDIIHRPFHEWSSTSFTGDTSSFHSSASFFSSSLSRKRHSRQRNTRSSTGSNSFSFSVSFADGLSKSESSHAASRSGETQGFVHTGRYSDSFYSSMDSETDFSTDVETYSSFVSSQTTRVSSLVSSLTMTDDTQRGTPPKRRRRFNPDYLSDLSSSSGPSSDSSSRSSTFGESDSSSENDSFDSSDPVYTQESFTMTDASIQSSFGSSSFRTSDSQTMSSSNSFPESSISTNSLSTRSSAPTLPFTSLSSVVSSQSRASKSSPLKPPLSQSSTPTRSTTSTSSTPSLTSSTSSLFPSFSSKRSFFTATLPATMPTTVTSHTLHSNMSSDDHILSIDETQTHSTSLADTSLSLISQTDTSHNHAISHTLEPSLPLSPISSQSLPINCQDQSHLSPPRQLSPSLLPHFSQNVNHNISVVTFTEEDAERIQHELAQQLPPSPSASSTISSQFDPIMRANQVDSDFTSVSSFSIRPSEQTQSQLTGFTPLLPLPEEEIENQFRFERRGRRRRRNEVQFITEIKDDETDEWRTDQLDRHEEQDATSREERIVIFFNQTSDKQSRLRNRLRMFGMVESVSFERDATNTQGGCIRGSFLDTTSSLRARGASRFFPTYY
ncbi:hypothetical protein BLNAU_12883 [Blattamonas nauphoetae]|uniref:Uncharacterized protein n=1 Tax=Blattamonas nauphoetae TaxID=2049346 RepID=A0ABQ9XPZ6_9EUKA|nr:hypothetical protein BLNAU_12883 [Blattamonas nauphoetae]